jgi:carbonic anhydrase
MVEERPFGSGSIIGGSVIDRLLERNRLHGRSRPIAHDRRPRLRLAIVTCMDSRIDVFEAFGLQHGDAHVLRNAGGLVSDDTVRSLVLSQRLLGTTDVMLMHHTDCGLHGLDEAAFARELEQDTGLRPPASFGAFDDLDADVRRSIERVIDSPFVASKHAVRGFVYDVETGLVREVARET